MRLYFMGICGTAMGHVALLARELGHEVSGADTGIYPPMSEVLRAAGVTMHEGYDPARLEKLRPDLVVVGNVTTRGNPEMEWLLDTRAVAFVSMPALLGELVLRGRRNVVVTGTHGKTTTTMLAAYLLRSAGAEPGWLAGGVPRDLPGGAAAGSTGSPQAGSTSSGHGSSPFVIEGDEYDSAFFDKRSKFIHYQPWLITINNIEFDHADIFRDLADVQRTFEHLRKIVPQSGFILENGDDANIAALPAATWTTTLRVGTGAGNDLRLAEFAEDENGARFDLVWKGKKWETVRWGLPGFFNARNAAMAALAAGLALDAKEPAKLSLAALKDFRGARRRQEELRKDARVAVIEDFGHHPTAVRETLAALRRRYPGRKLLACLEPRSNTARTRAWQAELPGALAQADEVFIGPIHRAEKTPAAERLDLAAVCAEVNAAKRAVASDTPVAEKRAVASDAPTARARHFATNAAVLGAVLAASKALGAAPHAVVFFTNGSFDGIVGEFVKGA
jgi:UDP-N-acetylmuramate: L-alanyl-gamma-D-glutamyl-meso-diaminopimelate ligase